ncbi:MAG: hypothetical protein M3Z05_05515 [Gemmatimonadota bacterium]|nr:hypothetical protein [Gemmatimonadota bacterium]
MRTHYVVISLSLAAAFTACSKQDAPTAAVAKPAHPAPSVDLATAPRPYERMHFVSDIEQTKSNVQARSPEHARHANHASANHDALSATRVALSALTTTVPVPMAIASSAAPAPSIAIAATHAAPPIATPAAAESEMIAGHSHGGGLGGLVGSVMIRGGVGPNGKCDPRSDAQAAGMLAGRPNSAMPMMPSSSVFGRR